MANKKKLILIIFASIEMCLLKDFMVDVCNWNDISLCWGLGYMM